jgi:acyl-CoA dehydrogenase
VKIFDRSILNLPFFDDAHRRLAEEIEAWAPSYAELAAIPDGVDIRERGRRMIRLLGQAGWLEYAFGKHPDGVSLVRPDLRTFCLIREGLSFLDDLCDFAFSIQGLASAPIIYYGSDEQKSRYLADFGSGRKICSLAISEPAVGSNIASIQLRAVREGDHYVLDGEKTWISNGSIADYYCVFARTGEGPGALGLSCFIVPAESSRISVHDIDVMAPRPISSLSFHNCIVPSENLIGKAGMGFKYAMELLNLYRTPVGSAAIGFCRKALQVALQWSKSRRVSGTTLFDMQMTKQKFADMVVFLDAASVLVARASWESDHGLETNSGHTSVAKLYATEGAQHVVDDALQLFGAAGTVSGSVPEQLYRQIRSLRIYEGTSEIQRLIIAGALATA